MINGAAISRRYFRFSALNALAGLLLWGAGAWFVGGMASDLQAHQLGAAAQEILNVQAEALNGSLDKYRMLPVILGHRPDTAQLYAAGADAAITRKIAIQAAAVSGARDVVFLRRSGAVWEVASTGAAERFDAVVFNGHPQALSRGLLGKEAQPAVRPSRRPNSASSAMRPDSPLS